MNCQISVKGGILFLNQLKNIQMSALFILIGISLLVAGSFLAAFIWSVGNGQFDDDYTPSIRMLFDNQPKESTTTEIKN